MPRASCAILRLAAATCLLTLVAACASERYGDGVVEVPVELEGGYLYTIEGATTRAPESRWWLELELPGLDAAIEEAFERNLELHAAWVRIEQSRTVVETTESGLWPSLDAQATVGRSRSPAGTPSGAAESNNFQLSLSAGYELDLWGRNLASVEAAELDVHAARADIEATAMSLSAQITDGWLEVLYQRARRRLVERQLETARTFLELAMLRLRLGQATALDVLQQQGNVEALEARLPLVTTEEEIAQLRLAVLMGRSPSNPPTVPGDDLPPLPAPVDAGVPADLLVQRPDVRAAEIRARAADSRLVVAIAEQMPSVRLSATLFLAAADPVELFENIFWNVAASLVVPLIDGGRRSLAVERAELVLDERILVYGQTVLRAIEEVQTALVREVYLAEYEAALEQQYDSARRALESARLNFAAGAASGVTYDRVLNALVAVQNLESTLLDARRQRLAARITLYRALGGTWTRDLAQPPTLLGAPPADAAGDPP